MLRQSHALLLPAALLCAATQGWCYGPFNHLCVVNRHWDAILQQVHEVGPIEDWRLRDAVFAGALADDLGYYPGMTALQDLTDMTHYVRPGEWVEYVLLQSQDTKLNPQDRALLYAFALGVLSHYAIDRMGHYYGTNVVAAEAAGTAGLYGGSMSYERNPEEHKAVESGFDVMAMMGSCRDQLASNRIQAFAESKEWKDGEPIASFLLAAFARFYEVNLGVDVGTVVQALVQARQVVKQALDQGEKLYGVAARRRHVAPPTKSAAPVLSNPVVLADVEIAETITKALEFSGSTAQTLQYYRTFTGSFTQADGLFGQLLRVAARGAIAGWGIPPASSGASRHFLANINLDTNTISAAGRYVLADWRYEDVAAHGGTALCPPTRNQLATYFGRGLDDQEIFRAKAPSGEVDLHERLANIGKLLQQEHVITGNDLNLSLDLARVKFYRASFPTGGSCPAGSGALPFGTAGSICVVPTGVYWTDAARPRSVSLWFAALAAVRLSGVKDVSAQRQIVIEAERLRRENVEAYRLCDAGNYPSGYFTSEFCNGYGHTAVNPPPESCVASD